MGLLMVLATRRGMNNLQGDDGIGTMLLGPATSSRRCGCVRTERRMNVMKKTKKATEHV